MSEPIRLPVLLRDLARLRELAEKATPGPWSAWFRGNSNLADGTVVGQSELCPVPRPYNPVALANRSSMRRTILRDEDCAHIVAHDPAATLRRVEQMERLVRLVMEMRDEWARENRGAITRANHFLACRGLTLEDETT